MGLNLWRGRGLVSGEGGRKSRWRVESGEGGLGRGREGGRMRERKRGRAKGRDRREGGIKRECEEERERNDVILRSEVTNHRGQLLLHLCVTARHSHNTIWCAVSLHLRSVGFLYLVRVGTGVWGCLVVWVVSVTILHVCSTVFCQ